MFSSQYLQQLSRHYSAPEDPSGEPPGIPILQKILRAAGAEEFPTEAHLLKATLRAELLRALFRNPPPTEDELQEHASAASEATQLSGRAALAAINVWAWLLRPEHYPPPAAVAQQGQRSTETAPPDLTAAKGKVQSKPQWQLPKGFQLTEEFRETFRLVEEDGLNLCLTGDAGTGKSTWLRYLVQHTQKRFIILAPTGIAAVNIHGETIHSFFGFPLRTITPQDKELRAFRKHNPKRKVVERLELLVIDEASMVRADLLDAIDQKLRNTRKNPAAFGGIQVVLIGDLYQLPPVIRSDDAFARALYPSYTSSINADPQNPAPHLFGEQHIYESPYFFSARAYREGNFKRQHFRQVFRQTDHQFLQLLDTVRYAQHTATTLQLLNERVEDDAGQQSPDEFRVILVSTNRKARDYNTQFIRQLKGKQQVYKARIEDKFPQSAYPTDKNLMLKEGAQVLFLRNDLPARRWMNGTLGIVTELQPEHATVRLKNGKHVNVEPVTWENIRYSWDARKKRITEEILGSFTQLPLRLGWAITIHKSQGLTFQEVTIDLGRGAFAAGQTYVALSRCRHLEGIRLVQPLRPRDIRVDPNISRLFG